MDILSLIPAGGQVVIVAIAVIMIWMFVAVCYRKVVATNMVHIVQSRSHTTAYGTGQLGSNVYYKWPQWIPRFGVTVIELPVSNFAVPLKDYEAYDKDRVPFRVDVVAFFRIQNMGIAAQRIKSEDHLNSQLLQIVQGAVRKVLASAKIDMMGLLPN